MDTDKKLDELLSSIDSQSQGLGALRIIIEKSTEIARSYEGYTTGPDDEEFF